MLINTLLGTAFVAGIIHAVLFDHTYLLIYFGCLIPYTVIT